MGAGSADGKGLTGVLYHSNDRYRLALASNGFPSEFQLYKGTKPTHLQQTTELGFGFFS